MKLNQRHSPPSFVPGRTAHGETSVKEGLEPTCDLEWSWELVAPPPSPTEFFTSQCFQLRSRPHVGVAGSNNDKASGHVVNVHDLVASEAFSQTEPVEREKGIYGDPKVTRKVRDRWLKLAAAAISENRPRLAKACRDYAKLNGLDIELERQILIHDVETSSVQVQQALSEKLVLLFLILEEDYCSEDTLTYIRSNRDEWVERLLLLSRISAPPQRPKQDEIETTSLVRALLELSGGKVDLRQHVFLKESTVSRNIELFASVFGIKKTREAENIDMQDLNRLVSESPVFSRTTVSVQSLHNQIVMMRSSLRLGFREGHLNLPPRVLSGLGFGQVEEFHCYISLTYQTIPAFEGPQSNKLMLLTWSSNLSSQSTNESIHQLGILQEWAHSEDGRSFYDDMARTAQTPQSVEQLALITVAMLGYSRLIADFLDYLDRPIQGSYLADLDSHFHGHALGNRGRVTEQVVFALIRVLSTFGDEYEELITFLTAVLDREPLLLHAYDGLSDRYLRLRMMHYDHEDAFLFVMKEISYSRTETNLKDSDNKCRHEVSIPQVVGAQSTARTNADMVPHYPIATFLPGSQRCLAASDLSVDHYLLARLSKTKDEDVAPFFDTHAGTLSEVPSFVALGDGSYEVVVLISHCNILRNRLSAILPDSDFDLDYDPLQPMDIDLNFWDYKTSKTLRQYWFSQRAVRVIQEGWSTAAAYYSHRLKLLHSLGQAAEKTCAKSADNGPMLSTFKG